MKIKNHIVITSLITGILTSCIPDNIKHEMDEKMNDGKQMLADQEFKKGIAYIELHKVRYGSYPKSLRDLTYLSAFDSSLKTTLEYRLMDSVYELNIHYKFPSFSGKEVTEIGLKYPKSFWQGIGCVKSNTK